MEDIIDEDSSSNSVSLKIESKPTEKEYSIKSDDTNFPLKQTIKIVSNYDKAKESEENEDSESDSNVSEYDASSQGKDTISESSANTSQKRKQEELVKAKVPPSKKIVLNAPVSKKIVEPEPDSEDLDEEEEEEEYSSEDEVGPAIEEPVRLVKGEGSGKNCKSPNPCFELEIGECIEESIMYFYGEGAGQESLVGNTGKEEPQKEGSGNKQLFFFGKPGCLNNSPVKSPPQSSMFSLSMPSGNPKPMLVDYDSDSDSNSMDKKEDSKEAISNAEVPNKEENNCQSELKEPEKGEMTLLEKITQALNDDSEESKPKVEKNHSTDGSLASPSDLSTQSTHDKTDNAILKEAKVVASWKIEKDGVFANKSTVLEKNLENIITSEIIESPVVDQKIDVCETSIESQKESLIVEKSIENIVRKIPEAPIESTHTVDESTIKIPSTQNDESIEIAIAAIEPVQEIDNSVIEQSESDEHNSNQIDEISEKCEEKLQIDDEINFSESISNAETTKTLEINENEVLVESVRPIPEKEIIPEESIETSSTQERDLVIEESPDILAPTINEGELNSIEEPNSTVQNEILQTEPIVQMEICPEEVSDLSINQLPIELTIDEKLDIDNLSEVSDEDDDILNQTDTNGPKSLDEQINQEPERSIPREFLNEISVENIDEISQNENNLRDDEKIESPESQIQSSSIIEASPEVIDEIPMPSVDHNSNSQTLEIVQNPEVVTSEPKQSDTVLEIIQPIAEIPIASNSPLKEAENLEIDEDKMSVDDDESQGSLNIVESNHEIPEEPLCKMESAERLSYEKEEYVPCMSKETVNRDIILELEPIPDSAKSLELPIDTDVESQIIVPSSSQSLPEFIPAADSVKINKPIKHQLHVDEPVCVAKFFTPLVDENEEPKAIQPETPVDLQQHQPMETVENLSQQEVQFPTKISKETKDPEPITSSMLSEPNSLEIECLINVQSPKQIPPSAIDIQPHLPSEAQKLEVTSIPEINEIPIIPKKSQGQEKVAKILEEKISGELLSAPIDSKLIAEKANTSKAIPLIVEKIAEVTNPISLKKIAPIALENPAIKVLQSHESSPELPFKGFEKFECEQDIEMEEISKSTDNPFESIKLNENLSPRKRMTLLPANRKRRYSKDKPSTTESESDDLSHSDAAVSPPEVSADENEEDKEVELASKKPKIREKLVPVPPKKKQALRKEASPIKEEIKPEPTMSKLRSANREPPKAPPPKVAKKPVVSKKIIVPDVPIVEETDLLPESKKIIVSEPITPKIELKFDYDPSEAEATVSKEAIIAQVKSLKKKEETSESKSSSDENEPPVKARRGRKPKAAKRVPAKKEVKSSDSSDDENEKAISSKAKTTVPATEADVTPLAKKRGRGASKGIPDLSKFFKSVLILF